MEVHERISVIYGLLRLNQKEFSESIGFAQATVSRMVRQKGKPSFEFLESMFKKYPQISKDWVFHEIGQPISNLSKEEIENFIKVQEPHLHYGKETPKERQPNDITKRVEILERQVKMLEITILSSSK
jgi:transcriptional regulator with XRE-family HTH domain